MEQIKEQPTYFEVHGEELLRERGITKARFAKDMGVIPQNINKLFATKNVYTLTKAASYLNLPLQVLLYGKDDTMFGCIFKGGQPYLVKNREDLLKLADFPISEKTIERLGLLRQAFSTSYNHPFTMDDFIDQMSCSVEDGDPAVWEIFCGLEQKK